MYRCLRLAAVSLLLLLGLCGARVWADGLILLTGIPGTSLTPLAVRSHRVKVTVKDQLATTEVDQVFFNPGSRQVEGTYLFPIPKNAQIDKLRVDVNGTMQEAELMDARKARELYESIVRASRDPALLEYAGQGLFRLRIFPIEPRSEKRVRVTYSEVLKRDNGLIEYTYPLNTEKFSSAPLENVSIDVDLESAQGVKAIYSPSHDVEIRRHDAFRARVSFEARAVKPDADFQLFFSDKAGPEIRVNLLTYRDREEPDGYFLLLATPPDEPGADRVIRKDVTFVLDTSGSMGEAGKLAQAKKALAFCLSSLNRDDRFQLIRFSTDTEPLFPGLVPADRGNRDKALAFVRELEARGGTAIDDTLTAALGAARDPRDKERPRSLVFLTDGRPTVGMTKESVILANALRNAAGSSTRVFSFGIGTDVNTFLLDQLSEGTRGVSQYVLPQEDIEVKVSSFFRKISNPVLTDPRIEVASGIRLAGTLPRVLPDLFAGEQLLAVGRYHGGGRSAVSILGAVNGEARTLSEAATFRADPGGNPFIAKLWATRRIGFLLDELRLRGESRELRDEVAFLARKFGIVTPATAYLIVEDEARRGVPMTGRSLQGAEVVASANSLGRIQFDSMNQVSSGGVAVSNAQALSVLKKASKNSSFASSNATAQNALTGAAAADSQKIQDTLNAQQARNIAGRTFYQNANGWIDSNVQSAKARTVKVTFASPEYFALMDRHPDAAQWLSVGRNVQILLGDTLYEVVD